VVIANFLKSWSWRGRRAPLCETLSNQDGHKGDTPPGLFLTISPEASGNQLADDAIVLVENEYLARRPKTESQVGAAGLVFARSRVLFADQLQQGLALATIVEQDAPNGVMAAAVGVRTNVENLAARIVAEDDLVLQGRDFIAAVDRDAGDGYLALEQWVGMVVFHQPPDQVGAAARIVQINLATDVAIAAFPDCPAEIAAGSDRADLLNMMLPDVSQQHASRRAVPGEALRIAHPIGIDVGQSVASS